MCAKVRPESRLILYKMMIDDGFKEELLILCVICYMYLVYLLFLSSKKEESSSWFGKWMCFCGGVVLLLCILLLCTIMIHISIVF